VHLRLDAMVWEDLPPPSRSLGPLPGPLISPQGDLILFTQFAGNGAPKKPYIFSDGASSPLPGVTFDRADVGGASSDFSHVVGEGLRPIPGDTSFWPVAWVWNAEHGLVELPTTFELATPRAMAVSNDGRWVIGRHDLVTMELPEFGEGATSLSGNLGVYWQDGQEARIIRGQNGEYLGSTLTCDAECNIVFGNTYWQTRETWWFPGLDRHIEVLRGMSNHAWYWKPVTGQSGSLGPLNPTEDEPKGWAYGLKDVSGDGGLAVGFYHSLSMTGVLPDGSRAYDGLIWSQATGFVQLSDLLAETGQSLDWPTVYAHSISPNGEYILLTTAEVFTAPMQPGVLVPSFARMALLHLAPKVP
jgi:hypothetical protein